MRVNGFIIAVMYVMCEGISWGQEAVKPASRSLFARANWAEWEVVFGRLVLVRPKHFQSRTQTVGSDEGPYESLSLSVREGIPSIFYEGRSAERQLNLEIIDGTTAELFQQPNDSTGTAVRFSQRPGQPIRLVVGESPAAREFQATTLWHLLLAEPEVCREHLLPILESFRPHWNLGETADQVETALYAFVHDQPELLSRERVRASVRRLSSPSFRERQAAERELKAFGPAVVSHLQRLRAEDLDAEQRHRVASVLNGLMVHNGDQPRRVAAWLCDNEPLWVILLSRASESQREVALRHLAQLNRLAPPPSASSGPKQIARTPSVLR